MGLFVHKCSGLWSFVVFHWLCWVLINDMINWIGQLSHFCHCHSLDHHCFFLAFGCNKSFTCMSHCLLLGFFFLLLFFIFSLFFVSHILFVFVFFEFFAVLRSQLTESYLVTFVLWHQTFDVTFDLNHHCAKVGYICLKQIHTFTLER